MKQELLCLFKNAFVNSFLYEIICWITGVLIPRIKHDLIKSKTLAVISWFEKNIMNNKYLEIFFNTKKVAEAWYDSAFYRYTTFAIRRIAFYIPRSRLPFKAFYIGIFLMVVLLFPGELWNDFYMVPLFMFIALLYISSNATGRIGVIFILINIIIFIFIAMMSMSIPIAACKTLSYFLLAIDLFFLISFAVRTQEDLELILMFLFLSAVILCCVGIFQEYWDLANSSGIKAVFDNSTIFSEIILILFPFAFVYPITLKSKIRSLLYSIMIMVITFVVITATQSRAAFIGFFAELIIVIFLINRRYIPMILILAPTFTSGVIQNIILMWNRESSYGNFFQNIIFAVKNFWSNGFGVSTSNFVQIYNSTAMHYTEANSLINVPGVHINALYFNIIVDLGAMFMIGFMYYILRIAHSSITCMFRATFKQKIILAAGLAALIGISLSSMFESNLFEPRVLIMYWAMLGLLRSGRIIRLGVFD